jgi:hypothetical protein
MSRRTFTKSAFLALFLPSAGLSVAPEVRAATKASSLLKLKKKVVLISVNLGFLPKNFSPDNDNTLNSRYLAKFKPVHHKMTMFNDIEQPERLGGHRNHHSVFTCQSRFGKVQTPFVSLDQLLATKSLQETRQKFTSISTSSKEGVSFNMNGLPIPPVTSPAALYDYLFGPSKSLKRLESKRETLLTFREKLVSPKSDKYYRDVIEERLDVLESEITWANIKPPEVDYTFTSSKNPAMDLPIYLDLIRLGLQKNQSNIMVLEIKNNGSVPLEGVTLGHHANSHHNKDKTKLTELGIIEDFIADKLAGFVTGLEKAHLLDDTIVLIAGNMGDPSLHSMKDMSVILAGGGFKHEGRRIPCKDKGVLIHPLATLYTTILHQAGMEGLHSFAGIPGNMDALLM